MAASGADYTSRPIKHHAHTAEASSGPKHLFTGHVDVCHGAWWYVRVRLSAWECARQSLTPDRCLVLLLHPSEPAVPTILIHALAFPPAVKSAQRGLPSKLFRTNLQRRAGQPPPAVTSSPARQVHRAASSAVLDAVCPDAGCLQQGYARAGRGGREDARQAHNTGTPACPPLRSVPSTRGALASDQD